MVKVHDIAIYDICNSDDIWEDIDYTDAEELIENLGLSLPDEVILNFLKTKNKEKKPEFLRIKDTDRKLSLICFILERSSTRITFDELTRRHFWILYVQNDHNKALEVFRSFLKNPHNPHNKIKVEDLDELKGLFGDFFKLFLEQENNPNNQEITIDDLIGQNGLLYKFTDKKLKSKILESFIANPDNPNHIKVEQLIKISKSDLIEPHKRISSLLIPFLKNYNNPENKITISQLINREKPFSEFPDLDIEEFTKALSLVLGNPNNKNKEITFRVLLSSSEDSILEGIEEYNSSLIVASFIKNPNNITTIDQLIGKNGILLKSPDEKNNDLKLIQFSDPSDKLAIVLAFLKNPNSQIDVKGLKEFLSYFDQNYHRQQIISSFLANYNHQNKLTIESLLELISFVGESHKDCRVEIVKSFFLNNPNKPSSKDLWLILDLDQFINDQNLKVQIIVSFLENRENVSLFNLSVTLKKFVSNTRNGVTSSDQNVTNQDRNKFRIVLSFLKNTKNPISFEELIGEYSIIFEFTDEYYKSQVACLLLKNLKHPISLDQLSEILIKFKDDNSKLRILSSFLGMDENIHNQINILKFIESGVLQGLGTTSKLKIITHFLLRKNNSENQITIDQLQELLSSDKLMQVVGESEESKSLIVSAFFRSGNHSNSLVDVNGLFLEDGILSAIGPLTYINKHLIISSFLKNPENQITSKQFLAENGILSGMLENDIFNLTVLFLSNTKNSINAKEFFSLESGILSKIWRDKQFQLISLFLENPNNKMSTEDLLGEKGILSLFLAESERNGADLNESESNESDRLKIVKLFIKKQSHIDILELSNIIKRSGFEYSIDKIVELYELLSKKDDFKIEDLIKDFVVLSKSIDYLQNQKIELLKGVIEKFGPRLSKERKQDWFVHQLNPFLKDITDDNEFINFVDFIVKKLTDLKDEDVLFLIRGKIHSRYSSIKPILEDQANHPLSELLTPEGIKELKRIFGDQSINFLDIFSYYDLKNELDIFAKIVKPEILDEIKRSFHIPKNTPFLSKDEMPKIKSLVGLESEKNFILVGDLCNFVCNNNIDESIKNFVDAKLKNEEEIKMHFQDLDEYRGDKSPEELNDLFRNLINKKDPKGDDYRTFFTGLFFNIDFSRVADKDLQALFLENRNEIIYGLLHEDIGVEGVAAAFFSLKDGCIYNSSSQINILLRSSISNGPCCDIIKMVLSEDIIPPILRSERDLILRHKDLFENPLIKSFFVSPAKSLEFIATKISKESLFRDLLNEEFFNDKNENKGESKIMNCVRAIVDEHGDNVDPKFFDNLEIDVNSVLAYLVLEKTLGEEKMKETDFEDFSLKTTDMKIRDLVENVKKYMVEEKPKNSVRTTDGKPLIPNKEKTHDL